MLTPKDYYQEKNEPIMQDDVLFNLDYLHVLTENDERFIKELLGVFVTTVPKMTEEMNIACNSKDWEEVKAIAHKLKPIAETLRIESILEDIKFVENTIKEKGNLKEIPNLISKIDGVLKQVTGQLKEIVHI
ncbi:Hpt domain-containing protein [Foetidibacter luteolus]|uniref:Hpt domain-containing protein n=1 Tax=Foetidibacter luteolus TaxID=2608880 RepID=UPI00129B675C|nr:Hpt domain-containing protein [Foetidibacter luteolus]